MQKYTPGNRDILQSRSEWSSHHIVILGCNPDDQFAEPFPGKMRPSVKFVPLISGHLNIYRVNVP